MQLAWGWGLGSETKLRNKDDIKTILFSFAKVPDHKCESTIGNWIHQALDPRKGLI
jgi:hypothetical protein